MSKRRVKSIKMKEPYFTIIKIIGIILCILLGIYLFYLKEISDLTKIGYSREASNNILFSFHKDYVLSIGENKTLNKAFESEDFNEKYMDNYSKIDYVNHEHLIKNINNLIEKKYSNNDINIILKHGNDKSVSDFAKRDKIRYLEEFYSISYAKLDNYDRYVNYSNDTGDDEEIVVLNVNLDMDKENYVEPFKVDEFSYDMVVNKHRNLGDDFVPDNLIKIDTKYASEAGMESNRVAFNAYKKMQEDALKEGYEIVINSAYRSYQDQEELVNTYRGLYGDEYVNKFVALPGFSEHQTGLAYDIGSRKVNVFANSSEYEWMLNNAYKYGFILRFPKKYENITGFRSEPWHYRYVGKKIAKVIYDEDMTLEEYFAKFLDKE